MTHPTERETCDHCAGTGIAGHPDSGYTCHRCEGSGALARPSAPETLAWAVLGEDEVIVPSLIRESRSLAATGLFGRKRVVPVAIRRLEDEA